jgi:hypothetical protein
MEFSRVVWRLASQSVPEMYSFALGAMILVQFAIHMRHFRNLFLFRAARSDAVRGRIEYSRRVILRSSSFELVEFSGLFFALFAFTHSWFVLGGGGHVCQSQGSIGASHARTIQPRGALRL